MLSLFYYEEFVFSFLHNILRIVPPTLTDEMIRGLCNRVLRYRAGV